MRSRIALSVAVVLASFGLARAQTNVSGVISTQTWTVANSPYVVVGTVTVPAGSTLTIDPGVTVQFDANAALYIEGSIYAVGTPIDSVLFVPGASPAWMGLRISGTDSSTLSYVRITGGNANGAAPDDRGGAISIVGPGARLGLSHSVFKGNSAQTGGGAIYAYGAHITAVSCMFQANTAVASQGGGGGGAINALNGSTLELSYCTFDSNTASADHGGGIYLSGSTLIGDSLHFRKNQVYTYGMHGGGVSAWSSSQVALTRCDFVGNNVTYGSGGGLYINGSSVELRDCASTGNTVAWNGGGIETYLSTVVIDHSSFTNNTASDRGSGVFINHQSVATLDSLTVTGNASAGDGGGGIYIYDGATATVTNCAFDSNLTTGYYGHGGGVRVQSATATISDCSIRWNRTFGTGSAGGGLWAQYSTLTLSNTAVTHDSAQSTAGGIALWDGTNATVRDCPVDSNVAVLSGGGGITGYNSTSLFERCPVRGNVANMSGGGVKIWYNANMTLRTLAISGNTSTTGNGGGVADSLNAALRMTNCPVLDNVAGLDGGGLYVDSSPNARFENVTVAGNTAQHGGGMRAVSTTNITVVNCTFSNNVASVIGGGIRAYNSTLTVYQSILWGDSPQELYLDGTDVYASYSDIADSVFIGVGNLSADPLFADAANRDYSLLTGSPCINAGDPAGLLDRDGTIMDIGVLPYDISEISGTVLTTTWTKANSPYRISGTATIPPGNTLTIEPGVQVIFDANVEFLVQGSIHAVGTQADSIRFRKWLSPHWAGFRIIGGDSSTFAYTRVSDAYAPYDGTFYNPRGGGFHISDAGTRVGFSHCVISRDTSYYEGGGAIVYNGARATFDDCTIRNNASLNSSGGGVVVWSATASFDNCVVSDNWSDYQGGGIFARTASTVDVRNTVVVRNAAYYGGGIFATTYNTVLNLDHALVAGDTTFYSGAGGGLRFEDYAVAYISNSIVAGNLSAGSPNQVWNFLTSPLNIFMNYSLIDGTTVWPGTGNLNGIDPQFVDAAHGDYHLQPTSPCIDAGDPNAPLDPDGSRTDIGPFFYMTSPYRLQLPNITVLTDSVAPGDLVLVPITAWLNNALSLDLFFVGDTSVIAPDSVFFRGTAFDGLTGSQVLYNQVGDTTEISMAAATGLTVSDSVVATLAFRLKSVPSSGTDVPLAWVAYPKSSVDEQSVVLASGKLAFRLTPAKILYGDVSGDGQITSFDAGIILQYVVGIRSTIDQIVADVTGNGRVTGFDAANVLYRVLDSTYVFPVQGGPSLRPAARTSVTLSWVPQRDGSWTLIEDNPSAFHSGDFTIAVPADAHITVTGGNLIAYRQEGGLVRISVVRTNLTNRTVLSLSGGSPLSFAPKVTDVQLDENQVVATVRPVALALAQNTPNPFNPTTTIRYALPSASNVLLAVYDVNGQVVRTLVNGNSSAGAYTVVWDGRDGTGRAVASGVYLYRLTAGDQSIVRRMVLVR